MNLTQIRFEISKVWLFELSIIMLFLRFFLSLVTLFSRIVTFKISNSFRKKKKNSPSNLASLLVLYKAPYAWLLEERNVVTPKLKSSYLETFILKLNREIILELYFKTIKTNVFSWNHRICASELTIATNPWGFSWSARDFGSWKRRLGRF